jgi:hypothetical protein
MSWYLVGPDKTGLDCSDCCAAFYLSDGSCSLRPCSVIGGQARRNYVCPSTSFPTDFHYYKRNPTTGDITIAPNPRRCSSVAPECATYSPTTGLNAAGRVGTGCSQTYVEATYGCNGSMSSCSDQGCDTACGYVQVGNIYYTSSCTTEPNATCSCVSGPTVDTCGCALQNPPTSECPQCGDPGAPCCTRRCPDGSIVCVDFPCPCDGLPAPSCTECQDLYCVDGEELICVDKTCATECSAGYECSCGVCVCNTSSTCCAGLWGYSFNPETRECTSCGHGYNSPRNGCCDVNYIRKGCEAGSICCNDGRCYAENTTLCIP